MSSSTNSETPAWTPPGPPASEPTSTGWTPLAAPTSGTSSTRRRKPAWVIALSLLGIVVSLVLRLAGGGGETFSPHQLASEVELDACLTAPPAGASPAALGYLHAVEAATPAWRDLDATIADQGLRIYGDDLRTQADADQVFLAGLTSIEFPDEEQRALGQALIVAVQSYDDFLLRGFAQFDEYAQHQSEDDALNETRADASARLRDALSLPPSRCDFNRP